MGAPAADDVIPAGPPPPPLVAHAVVDKPKPRWQFAANTPEGRGERAFASPKIGGEHNAMPCRACHAVSDERKGIFEHGHVKPSSTMFGAAARATLWQGIATSPGEAADICARMYMLRPAGLAPAVRKDVEAYLNKLAPDPQPPLDWDTVFLTFHSPVPDAGKGDARRGKKLVGVYCKSCHRKGGVRAELTPGLYEADMLVARVRHQPGSDNRQMPFFTVTRLPDSELRDIVTYLVGTPRERIFTRHRGAEAPVSDGGAAAAAPAAPGAAHPR